MISRDVSEFAGADCWYLVKYVLFEGGNNYAWVKVLESLGEDIIVHEVDGALFVGDLESDEAWENDQVHFIGGNSCKEHILKDIKIRKKDEMELILRKSYPSTQELFNV